MQPSPRPNCLRAAACAALLGFAALVCAACGSEEHPEALASGSHAGVTVDYPRDGSIFPPDFAAPRFLWHDTTEGVERWRIRVTSAQHAEPLDVTTDGPPPVAGEIDEDARGPTNELYEPTPYQASARTWRPDPELWKEIKQRSAGAPAEITIEGLAGGVARSRGLVHVSTSADPVGAPIFYRDVPLMPGRGEKGRIQPLRPNAVPLIAWRLKDVSEPKSRLLLTGMPTCANCHSFSRDGKTLGMDVDGPDGDKGAYAMVPVEPHTVVRTEHVMTWSDFPDKPPGHRTLGFLSRVSPDGRYALSTVNEAVYVANFLDYRFLQVFFPTRGILGLYDRTTGSLRALPGADDPAYVQCDPVWTPDGKEIVFARAAAKDPYVQGRPLATHANDPNEVQIQYDLVRMPFNEGRGGTPVPIPGASANGMSNTFPKVSPDGRWMVWTKCRNGQLMRPDGRLWIVSLAGGQPREMNCNLPVMNSWHSFSPNGRWLVFSSKSNRPYTQMFLTHIDENGNDSPALLIEGATADNRAVNIPEFVNVAADAFQSIEVPAVQHYRDVQTGVGLLEEGKFDEALKCFERALETDPDMSLAHANVGRILAERGRLDDALEHYRRALAVAPRQPIMHVNLGFVLGLKGQRDASLRAYREALRIDPEHALAHNNLGFALLDAGNLPEALEHLQKAVASDPELVVARKNLGFALLRADRLEEAAAQYAAGLERSPQDPVALASLSRIRILQGRTEEGLRYLEQVVEADPKDLPSVLVLAWNRATNAEEAVRDGARAVELAKQALLLHGRPTARGLDVLAAAQAEAGDFAGARNSAEEALRLVAPAQEDSLGANIRARLELYRAGKPYRSQALETPPK